MSFDRQLLLENCRKYLENRAKYPVAELLQYAGTWIAWSPDGTRIVASAKDLDQLEQLVAMTEEDPLQCTLESIPEGDGFIGGGSFEEP
jgi:hypothetical protein